MQSLSFVLEFVAIYFLSSPHVSDPVSLTPMGEAVLKSHSLPPSVISSARGKIRLTRQNDKLVAKGLQTDIRVHPDKNHHM